MKELEAQLGMERRGPKRALGLCGRDEQRTSEEDTNGCVGVQAERFLKSLSSLHFLCPFVQFLDV